VGRRTVACASTNASVSDKPADSGHSDRAGPSAFAHTAAVQAADEGSNDATSRPESSEEGRNEERRKEKQSVKVQRKEGRRKEGAIEEGETINYAAARFFRVAQPGGASFACR
jgi:hypothetical protein